MNNVVLRPSEVSKCLSESCLYGQLRCLLVPHDKNKIGSAHFRHRNRALKGQAKHGSILSTLVP